MPWTKTRFPVSMKNLPAEVRDKAIEIGNALLKDTNTEEGIAIATAISRAKDWAVEHRKTPDNPKKSEISDVKKHGKDRYVMPHENEWAIKVEGKNKPEKIFRNKKDAVKQARKEAKEVNGSLTIQRKTGKIERKISYNPKNSGIKQY